MKELRLAGISDVQAGNAFLPAFMERYNERFAVPPARTQDLHRPLRTTLPRLTDILCHRELRYVGAQLTFHYDRKKIILEQTEVAKGLEGQYVELFDYWGKPMEVRWRGHALPYRIFSKDQRASHTAIVENKRLGHALAIVKAQQDLRSATKVLTNSEKTGYKKRGRKMFDSTVGTCSHSGTVGQHAVSIPCDPLAHVRAMPALSLRLWRGRLLHARA